MESAFDSNPFSALQRGTEQLPPSGLFYEIKGITFTTHYEQSVTLLDGNLLSIRQKTTDARTGSYNQRALQTEASNISGTMSFGYDGEGPQASHRLFLHFKYKVQVDSVVDGAIKQTAETGCHINFQHPTVALAFLRNLSALIPNIEVKEAIGGIPTKPAGFWDQLR